jgi:hypothetical protein
MKPLILLLLFTAATAMAGETNSLAKQLEPLRPFLAKTWRGHFKNSTPEKPTIDVSRWERALNGQAVRVLHSINQGKYGGETIIMWNRKNERLEYDYFTTAGFITHGTLKIEDRKMITHEVVIGSEEGITEVEAVSELLADGKFHSKSRYLKKGEWVDGHEVTYEEAPEAQVVFK